MVRYVHDKFICDGRKVRGQTSALHHPSPRGSIHAVKHATRKHSSRMRTARLLTVVCVCVCVSRGCVWGCVSVDRQMPVKALPSPKLRLQTVIIHGDFNVMRTANISSFAYHRLCPKNIHWAPLTTSSVTTSIRL